MNDYQYKINNQESSLFKPPSLSQQVNIAIIQPGSWGDNVNSTLMLKPIKNKHPNCQIDIYTTEPYASAFRNNPYIDNIISAQVSGKETCLNFVHIYDNLLSASGYNSIINASPVINKEWSSPRYPQLGENLILAWARALDKIDVEYDLPLETLLYLTQPEVENVSQFLTNKLGTKSGRYKILMEVEGESGQSFWTPEWTLGVCRNLLADPDKVIFLSKRYEDGVTTLLKSEFPNQFFFAGDLTIRECAELFNWCDAFFSVSSGLSNACNTNWCNKTNKWIEVVNSETCSSMPIRRVGKTFWHLNDLQAFISKLPELL